MAPPKTMVATSAAQQQQVDQQAASKVAAKPRKRKANSNNNSNKQQQQQQVNKQPTTITGQEGDSGADKATNLASRKQTPAVVAPVAASVAPVSANIVPVERTTVKKQQVPSLGVKETSSGEAKQQQQRATVGATMITGKRHQLVAFEPDEIDAGIELDGSSNSGSSVKDMGEDQIKSASVSPVMAQSSIVNEHGTKQAIELAPIEQMAGSLCSPVGGQAKKISTTKQQLAANQQVIDADERQLQEKLQSKQRKSSIGSSSASNDNDANLVADKRAQVSRVQTVEAPGKAVGSIGSVAIAGQSATDKSAQFRRRFSSQSSQEALDGSLCKVCQLHVYQMERMLAEKSIYHKSCFRCHQCKIQLRVDNYSSHEGQVYCKAHHRQLFQPQVKLDSEDDVDIVAKSTSQTPDDYLLHRGRLSQLSFSFLKQEPKGILKRQMIICENEPAELPKDVVRSDTKMDDGIDQLNLNLNNILERFERGTASDESQPSSAGVLIEKPSFNIKQTLMAFESRLANGSLTAANDNDDDSSEQKRADKAAERPIVKKLANLNGLFNKQADQSADSKANSAAPVRPLPVRRSESLMMRLKKYESRIAGEQVADDDEDEADENNNDDEVTSDLSQSEGDETSGNRDRSPHRGSKKSRTPKKLDLSSLKSQWENGDINGRRKDDEAEREIDGLQKQQQQVNGDGEQQEELFRIRQQLARKRQGEPGSVKNIYENAIREAQLQQKQQQASNRRDSSDLSALNGFSTSGVQQQLLQNSLQSNNSAAANQQQQNGSPLINGSNNFNRMPEFSPNQANNNNGSVKDHFQLNLSKKANKLKERFELGLINNSSHDDSDLSDGDQSPALTKLEQIRQEKLEDLSVFTDGEIKAREARSLFQQIDRRISAANGSGRQPVANSRSLASIGASMRTKLTNQMNMANKTTNGTANQSGSSQSAQQPQPQPQQQQQPIRLTNNVRT